MKIPAFSKRSPFSHSALMFLLVFMTSFAAPAISQENTAAVDSAKSEVITTPSRLQAILAGTQDPETTQDLQGIQDHVKTLVDKVTPATVGLIIGEAAGSGVIISNDGFVLTAGHVSMKPNLEARVIMPDGKVYKAKTLGINHGIDSGLIKITDEGSWPYLEMGTSSNLEKGQWIIALGHPGGYEPNRKPVLRLGRILSASTRVIRTDCVLIGGDSGGPLMNMDGQVVGIHSRINENVTSNYHVPVDTYGETWDRLEKGEMWGGGMILGGEQPYLGFKLEKGKLVIREVTRNGPAAKAGLKVGDKILKFGDRKIESQESLRIVVLGLSPGNKVSVVVERDGQEVTLEITIGKRTI